MKFRRQSNSNLSSNETYASAKQTEDNERCVIDATGVSNGLGGFTVQSFDRGMGRITTDTGNKLPSIMLHETALSDSTDVTDQTSVEQFMMFRTKILGLISLMKNSYDERMLSTNLVLDSHFTENYLTKSLFLVLALNSVMSKLN